MDYSWRVDYLTKPIPIHVTILQQILLFTELRERESFGSATNLDSVPHVSQYTGSGVLHVLDQLSHLAGVSWCVGHCGFKLFVLSYEPERGEKRGEGS